MLRQPARVPSLRSRGRDRGRHAVLDLHAVRARADPLRGDRRRRAHDHHRAGVPATTCSRPARSCPNLEHVIVIDGEAPEGVVAARRRRRRSDPDFDVEASVAQLGPAGPAHAHLHVRHDRAAQGRPALAPQPAGRRRAGRAAHRVPARRARHLVAARRARRRAQRPPLPADRLRAAGHVLRRTRARSSATCPRSGRSWFFAVPRIWEKLKAGLEAMVAAPARRAARHDAGRGRATHSRRCASSRPARRSPPTSPTRVARPTARSSPACARCSGSTRSSRSTSARRRRRSRCSSSSTPSACRWPSCGA